MQATQQNEKKTAAEHAQPRRGVERVAAGHFKPGQSGNPNGRPKGQPNKVTQTQGLLHDAVVECRYVACKAPYEAGIIGVNVA